MGHHDDALFRFTGRRDDRIGVVRRLFREQEVVEFVVTEEFKEQGNEGEHAQDECRDGAPVPVDKDRRHTADDGEGDESHERLAMYLKRFRVDFGGVRQKLVDKHLLALQLLLRTGRTRPAGADDVGDHGHTFGRRFL